MSHGMTNGRHLIPTRNNLEVAVSDDRVTIPNEDREIQTVAIHV